MQLSDLDIKRLNSKQGSKLLFENKKFNLDRVLKKLNQEEKIAKLQATLINLQTHIINNQLKVVILFEGRDAAGKGGAIRRITEYLNPRQFRIIALDKPTKDEQKQWFFQRYVQQLPKPGEIVLFDRSWYNRAVVEPVNNFCTTEEYQIFMNQVNLFENMLVESNTHLLKLYFSISKDEQAKRFKEIKQNPLKQWKITAVDKKAQTLWDDYTHYKTKMFKKTHTVHAPWEIIDANDKGSARIKSLEYILEKLPCPTPTSNSK